MGEADLLRTEAERRGWHAVAYRSWAKAGPDGVGCGIVAFTPDGYLAWVVDGTATRFGPEVFPQAVEALGAADRRLAAPGAP